MKNTAFIALVALSDLRHAECALVRSITTCHEDYVFVIAWAVMLITHSKHWNLQEYFPSLGDSDPAFRNLPPVSLTPAVASYVAHEESVRLTRSNVDK